MAKTSEKHYHEEDKLTLLVRKIEAFIANNIKIIVISTIFIIVIIGIYFALDYFISKGEEKANNSFGLVYINYKALLNDKSLKKEDLNKKLLDIVKDFQKVEKQYPKTLASSRSALFAGNILYSLDKIKEAAEEYKKGYKNKKNSYITALCIYNEALCYIQLEDYNKAEETYKIILNDYKKSYLVPTVNFELAQLYEAKNNVKMAKTLYNDIINKYDWSNWKDLAKKRLILVENYSNEKLK